MARRLQNNLHPQQAILILDHMSCDAEHLAKLIKENRGSDPVLSRRAETLVRKIEELLTIFAAE